MLTCYVQMVDMSGDKDNTGFLVFAQKYKI